MSTGPTGLQIALLIAGTLAALVLTTAVLGLPLLYWPVTARTRRRLARRGLVHVIQHRHLSGATPAGTVILHRRRTWYPSLTGRRLVFVYAGTPGTKALKFNHGPRRLRQQPIWTHVAIAPDQADTWLHSTRAYYRPIDHALAVANDYTGPAALHGPAILAPQTRAPKPPTGRHRATGR